MKGKAPHLRAARQRAGRLLLPIAVAHELHRPLNRRISHAIGTFPRPLSHSLLQNAGEKITPTGGDETVAKLLLSKPRTTLSMPPDFTSLPIAIHSQQCYASY